MKQVIYKEIIQIDGKVYTVAAHDYSEFICDLTNDFVLGTSDVEILDYIIAGLK